MQGDARNQPAQAIRIDHFAIVTGDLASASAFYRDVLGCEVGPPIERAGQGLRKCFVELSNMQLELIEPTAETSPIRHLLEHYNVSDFLRENPQGGLHHVCLSVPDLEAARRRLLGSGRRFLGSGATAIGAAGQAISFLDPDGADGLLVEFKQAGPGEPAAGRNKYERAARADHFAVVVAELDSASSFYAGGLGCELTMPAMPQSHGAPASRVCLGDVSIELHVLAGNRAEDHPSHSPQSGFHHVCFAVDDIAVVEARLARAGVRVLDRGRANASEPAILSIDPTATGGAPTQLRQRA